MQEGQGGNQGEYKSPDGKPYCGAYAWYEMKKDRDGRDQHQSLPQAGDECLGNELRDFEG
jgi:hypothetical protein